MAGESENAPPRRIYDPRETQRFAQAVGNDVFVAVHVTIGAAFFEAVRPAIVQAIHKATVDNWDKRHV